MAKETLISQRTHVGKRNRRIAELSAKGYSSEITSSYSEKGLLDLIKMIDECGSRGFHLLYISEYAAKSYIVDKVQTWAVMDANKITNNILIEVFKNGNIIVYIQNN